MLLDTDNIKHHSLINMSLTKLINKDSLFISGAGSTPKYFSMVMKIIRTKKKASNWHEYYSVSPVPAGSLLSRKTLF